MEQKTAHETAQDKTLFVCTGGALVLPGVPMLDRVDGGHLLVLPPRAVWDRTALTLPELTQWSILVAASAAAMLESLPQLADGCINYWDAGNWALNDAALPAGRKTAKTFRKLHLHLLGRSPNAQDAAWRWGEAPRFPEYANRAERLNRYQPLNVDECAQIVDRLRCLLQDKYQISTT